MENSIFSSSAVRMEKFYVKNNNRIIVQSYDIMCDLIKRF